MVSEKKFDLKQLRSAWGAGRFSAEDEIEDLKKWNVSMAEILIKLIDLQPPDLLNSKKFLAWLLKISVLRNLGLDCMNQIYEEVISRYKIEANKPLKPAPDGAA